MRQKIYVASTMKRETPEMTNPHSVKNCGISGNQVTCVDFREEGWPEEQGRDGWYRRRRLENRHDVGWGVPLKAATYFLRPEGFLSRGYGMSDYMTKWLRRAFTMLSAIESE